MQVRLADDAEEGLPGDDLVDGGPEVVDNPQLDAGLEPPRNVHVHGFLLVGGEKMSKTRLNAIAPSDLVADFGVDGFRYHFLRDQQFGPDGDPQQYSG